VLIDKALTYEALRGSTVEESDIVGLFLCGVQCDRNLHCIEVREEHLTFDRPSKGQLAQAREKSWRVTGFISSAATSFLFSGVVLFR
jgi:hypothetical protein